MALAGRRLNPPAPRWRREAGPDRLLGLELPQLARALLSARPAGAALARALRRALRHRRGERDLLPAAVARGGRELGPAVAGRVRVRGQGQPLPDAHEA